ncbi:PsbQ-like protein 3, chloroplastic [Linum perenne]
MITMRLASPAFFSTTQAAALIPSTSQKQCLQCHDISRIKHEKQKQHQQLQLDDDDDGTNYCEKKKLLRRRAICGTVVGFLIQNQCGNASGLNLDFEKMLTSGPSVPTLEDAVTLIRGHAASLLDVKRLLQEESWPDAQRLLRKSSSNLKIDLSSIIGSKPPALRPRLRSLYSTLFNTATRLDYAARDKDVALVMELYEKMAATVEEVLSAI